MSNGFLIYGYNNDKVDYTDIALCNALMIRANSSEKKVTLVTDENSVEWLIKKRGNLVKTFDQIILHDGGETQTRRFNDTMKTSHRLLWRNRARADAYHLSPYDNTMMIDADYLIMDNTLDAVWLSYADIMANKTAISLKHEPLHENEQRLEPYGIPMYWATSVFFRKTPQAERFFGMVENIRNHYNYYQQIYHFPGSLYRNDYSFSIAAHVLKHNVFQLPYPTMMVAGENDDLINVARNDFTFKSEDGSLARIRDFNIHVMNKFAIMRNADYIIEEYQ